jgi:hypothetical protein
VGGCGREQPNRLGIYTNDMRDCLPWKPDGPGAESGAPKNVSFCLKMYGLSIFAWVLNEGQSAITVELPAFEA